MSGLIGEISRVNDDNDEKWQKLVLYYLARLKGLCDWRSKTKQSSPKIHLRRCSSQELETRIIDKITNKPVGRSNQKQNCLDIGYYMAAGYEEGKQQAVKIISRSLKYGVMTGILLKRGNCYRIAPEYLYDDETGPVEKKKCSVKSVKTNVRKKNKTENTRKSIKQKKSNVIVKKRNTNVNNSATVKTKKGLKRNYETNSDENPPKYKGNKHPSDTNVNLSESSNSNTSFRSLSRSLTPLDDRRKTRDVKAKRPRPKIQEPINYVPPLKKPRTKSQSKSLSHHTDDDEVKDLQNVKNKHNKQVINKFRMPRPHRYSDVMSSMSSSSLSSSCTFCGNEKIKRNRHK